MPKMFLYNDKIQKAMDGKENVLILGVAGRGMSFSRKIETINHMMNPRRESDSLQGGLTGKRF